MVRDFVQFAFNLVGVEIFQNPVLRFKFGVAGKWAALASLACGVSLGVLYQLQIPYFEVGFYGLLLGLTASGFYAVGMRFADRANGK